MDLTLEESYEIATWAFGEGNEHAKVRETPTMWKELHPDKKDLGEMTFYESCLYITEQFRARPEAVKK